MKRFRKYIPLIVILGLSCVAIFFDLHHYFKFETFKAHQKFLEQFIESNLVLSMIFYIGIYITVVALSIPGAAFMTIAGGFLFDQWMGTIMAVVSATIGACFLFLSARMASSDLLAKKAEGFAARMQVGFQENAFSYLLTLRLIPLFPFVAVNLAAALFQIPMRTFFVGTLFGIIPGSFVFVSMGVALQKVINTPDFSPNLVLDPKILMAFVGLGALSLLPVIYKYFKRKRDKKS
jgi:uncharacterized membrane protein YdjX (TVP38/TMEM64 family)